MARSTDRRSIPALGVLCILIVIALGSAPLRVEGRLCSAKSTKFHGLCFSSTNCQTICHTEYFVGGSCILLNCVCKNPCAEKQKQNRKALLP